MKKLTAECTLRLGFGIMYLYSGFDLLQHPTAWHWAIPYWMRQMVISVIPLNTYLRVHGAIELILAACLLAWFLKPRIVKYVAAIAALEMAGILFLTFVPFSAQNFLVTFRDIGLLGGLIALSLILFEKDKPTPAI
jgi:hypothetical protein